MLVHYLVYLACSSSVEHLLGSHRLIGQEGVICPAELMTWYWAPTLMFVMLWVHAWLEIKFVMWSSSDQGKLGQVRMAVAGYVIHDEVRVLCISS